MRLLRLWFTVAAFVAFFAVFLGTCALSAIVPLWLFGHGALGITMVGVGAALWFITIITLSIWLEDRP